MKIRNLLLVAAVAAFGFTSCDLDELTNTEVSSTITTDVPLSADSKKSATLEDGKYAFLGTGTVNLSENGDVKDQIDKLKEMNAESAKVIVKGLPEDGLIYDVVLYADVKVGESNEYALLTFADANGIGNGYEIVLSADDIAKVNEMYAKWESLGFETAEVWFLAAGTANFDLATVEVDPELEIEIETLFTVGL